MEVIKPVLDRLGRRPNDPEVREDILRELHAAVGSGDLLQQRKFLSDNQAWWIGNLQWAFFQQFPNQEPLDRCGDWVKAKCSLLLAVLRATSEDDYVIQHILNYEDFAIEVMPFEGGPGFVCAVFELRGLDFFLFHYMGGETDAHRDPALFDGAKRVATALEILGRKAESDHVVSEIETRRAAHRPGRIRADEDAHARLFPI
ncbi:MAG: hypothetical protein FJY37_18710 [Betaproteobacteria bacterium]|nr:hypothetical protein [Betaproteobacteria bacterium]